MFKTRWGIGLSVVLCLLLAIVSCERNVTTTEQITQPGNCFGCHSDDDTEIVAAEGQWKNSQHASGENVDRNYSSCNYCHTSEGFIENLETGSAPSLVPNPTSIHCFTCHAPHRRGDFSLRLTSAQTIKDGTSYDLSDGNLCVACHQARRDVNTYVYDGVEFEDTHWGPHHGVQGDMLIGSNGYEYASYTYGQTNHRGITDDGCLDCHFKFPASYFMGGHSFNMSFDFEGDEEHNVAPCEDCHGGELEDFDIVFQGGSSIQDTVSTLIDSLRTLLEDAGLIADDETVMGVVTSADSAGAVWNFLMAHEDRSHGVHNPFYIVDLLISSIQFMNGSLPGPQPAAEEPARRNRSLARK